MASVKDYYETLGIKKDDSAAEIKRAYRKLARKHHPDLNSGNKASEEKFKEVNEAYAVLSDPKKKEEYDLGGRDFFEYGGRPGSGYPGGGGHPMGGTPGGGFNFEFGDVFSDIFSQSGMRSGQAVTRGADLQTGLKISLKEAFKGLSKRITLTREVACTVCAGMGALAVERCSACGGTGRQETTRGFFKTAQICGACGGAGSKATKACSACSGTGSNRKTETIDVKIPAGVDTGSTVRLRGMGNSGTGGGPPGDLRIKITVARHPLFERVGDDLTLKLPVTFGEAALGAKVDVPTIDGTAKMSIPPGTQGGQRFKLSGKGFKRKAGSGRGDMLVNVNVAVPKSLSKEAKEAIKSIDEAYGTNPRKGMKS